MTPSLLLGRLEATIPKFVVRTRPLSLASIQLCSAGFPDGLRALQTVRERFHTTSSVCVRDRPRRTALLAAPVNAMSTLA